MDMGIFHLYHPAYVTTSSRARAMPIAKPKPLPGLSLAISPPTLVASTPHRTPEALQPTTDPATLVVGAEQPVNHHQRSHAAGPPARVPVTVGPPAGSPLVVASVPAAVVVAAEPAHLAAVVHVDAPGADPVVATPMGVAEPAPAARLPVTRSSSRAVLRPARVPHAEGAVGIPDFGATGILAKMF